MIFLMLADGFEETEALVTLDLLRRAGIDVAAVGVGKVEIKGAHEITVKADIELSDIDKKRCDGIVLPGGMPGTKNLYASDDVKEIVMRMASDGKMTAAICAAPLILGRLGVLDGRKAVCFPGFENELVGADICDSPCVADGSVITARGAGAVFDFSHAITAYLENKELADRVLEEIQFSGSVC